MNVAVILPEPFMKFPFRFSIAVLLTLVAIAAGFLAGYQGSFRVPAKFEGVWKIQSATDDGTNFPLAADPFGALTFGECAHIELILTSNRLLIVSTDGRADVTEIREIAGTPELKLEMRGLGARGKRDGPSYAILKRSGPDLIFAWVGANANNIDASTGGKQIVYNATRVEPLDK